MAYVLAVEEQERYALLGALGVDKDPRGSLDEPFGVKAWTLPGQETRPAKPREPGVPDWWVDETEASDSFLSAMGVRLD